MKSSKLLHFGSFEKHNPDVVDFFLGGFGITLILSAVAGSDKISRLRDICGMTHSVTYLVNKFINVSSNSIPIDI